MKLEDLRNELENKIKDLSFLRIRSLKNEIRRLKK